MKTFLAFFFCLLTPALAQAEAKNPFSALPGLPDAPLEVAKQHPTPMPVEAQEPRAKAYGRTAELVREIRIRAAEAKARTEKAEAARAKKAEAKRIALYKKRRAKRRAAKELAEFKARQASTPKATEPRRKNLGLTLLVGALQGLSQNRPVNTFCVHSPAMSHCTTR